MQAFEVVVLASVQVLSQGRLTRLVASKWRVAFCMHFLFASEEDLLALTSEWCGSDRTSDFVTRSGEEWTDTVFGDTNERPDFGIGLSLEVKHSHCLGFAVRKLVDGCL